MREQKVIPEKRRKAGVVLLLSGLIVCIGLALTIPFVYETQTLWYKFGIDKTFLRAGKMVGLVAAILLCCQVLLVLRLLLLDRLAGLDRMYLLHRYNGILILVLVLVHASLVLIPEGMKNLPIGKKYWPEMVGIGLVLVVVLLVLGALLRGSLKVPYGIWRSVHRPLGYVALVLMAVHVFNVSDAFARPLPRYGLALVLTLVTAAVLFKKLEYMRRNRPLAKIKEVVRFNDSVTGVTIGLPASRSFHHLPGQFAFLRLEGKDMHEPHPFTLVSSPSDGQTVGFMIKSCGDWTARVAQALEGDRVWLDGPFGLFNHLAREAEASDDLILVAGGIGITPMLSMLRELATSPVSSDITLIWSNRSSEDMFLTSEIDMLQRRIPQLVVQLLYTRSHTGSRRLDHTTLKELTGGHSRSASIFICGPLPMMRSVAGDCIKLGFSRKNIHMEKFAL